MDPHDAIVHHRSSVEAKIALFRSLFRGREDVYPIRWESTTGRSGYSPACNNEWRPGVCEKPRIKCTDCPNQAFPPLSDAAIYEHLSGRRTLGVYPLVAGDTTWFIAADFDGSTWRDDAIAYAASCRELSIPAHVEISRSGDGAQCGLFSIRRLRQARHDNLPELQSPAPAHDTEGLHFRRTIASSRAKTRCQEAASAT